MKEAISMVKVWIDDLVHLLMSFVAVGAMSDVIFGSGVFGVNVIGNLTQIINQFGSSRFCWIGSDACISWIIPKIKVSVRKQTSCGTWETMHSEVPRFLFMEIPTHIWEWLRLLVHYLIVAYLIKIWWDNT